MTQTVSTLATLKKKKVLMINGSRRKQNTFRVLKQIEAHLNSENIDVEYIHLYDYDIQPCLGCFQCVDRGKCPIKDDLESIVDKMIASDGIVFSSPLYVFNISGKLKSFFDRTMLVIHRPKLVGKPALNVVTVMGSPMKSLEKYLNEVVMGYGMQPTGFIGKNRRALDIPVKKKEVQSFIKHLQMEKKNYRPSLQQLILFQVLKVLTTKILMEDRPYWVERGWDKAIFYYDCKIGLFKRIFAKIFFKMVGRKAKPRDTSVK